jgi:hypothetical protein
MNKATSPGLSAGRGSGNSRIKSGGMSLQNFNLRNYRRTRGLPQPCGRFLDRSFLVHDAKVVCVINPIGPLDSINLVKPHPDLVPSGLSLSSLVGSPSANQTFTFPLTLVKWLFWTRGIRQAAVDFALEKSK